MSDSLWSHESQHTRPPCPSPTPGVHSDSRPSSRWCHPAISSSVIPFSSCPQSFPASESFPMSQLFAWGGQSTGVSALASFLPKKSQIIPKKFQRTLNQAFREELMPILLKLFQKIAGEGTLSNAFDEATITLIPKPDKDNTEKASITTTGQYHWWT